MARLLLLALAALLAPVALAQTCTTSWTNPAGGAWETATNWSAGVPSIASTACITLAGTYTVAEAGTNRAVAGLVLGGASGTQTLAIGNSFTVTGDAVVRPNGRMELLDTQGGAAEGLYTGGTVTVEGVLVHRGGTTLLEGGTLDVAPGGRLELREGASVGVAARPSTYRIRGTLDAAHTSTQIIELPLDVQGGTVRVSQGLLIVRGGTLANATVDAAAGATLRLNSTASAPVSVTGTLSGAPAGEVTLDGGRVTAAPGGATLAVAGAGLLLSGNVVLTGGTFRNTGRLVPVSSNFSAVDGTTLFNAGRFVIPGGAFGVQNGGRIRNEASGTLELAGGGGIGFNGTVDGRLENAGVMLHTALPGSGTGEVGTINVPYDGLPGSVVRTQTGRLDFQVGGTLRDVSFDVPAGTEVNFQGGGAPLTLTGTLSGTPAGDLRVRDVLRVAAGPDGVTLAVGGTGLQVAGTTRLASAGGQFVNTGLLVWTATRVDQVVLENRGTLRLLGRFFLLNGAVARNVAGATTELYAFLEGDGQFENAGLLVAAGTGGAVTFEGRLQSLPGSEIRALRGGPRLDLDAPGTRTLPEGTTLTGTGSVLFRDGLEPEGTVSPGTPEQPLARLSFPFGFRVALGGNARVVVDVEAGGRSDTLAASTARLGGTLVVRVRPGYTPVVGDQWTVLTAASAVTGTFAQVVAENGSGAVFAATTAPDGRSVVLTVTQGVAAEDGPDGAHAFAVGTQSSPSPSPAVRVTLAEAASLVVDVFDAQGRRVARLAEGLRSAGVYALPVSGLAPGVYVARVVAVGAGGTERATQRLVVVR